MRHLLSNDEYGIKKLVGIDINESLIFFQDQEFSEDNRANFFVADVKDKETLTNLFKGQDLIFHCAALKHVIISERSPEQALQTNIKGVENVINAAIKSNVEKVIFTSSDKAVNPTNVMGSTKLMGERLISAANCNSVEGGPTFLSTRFGNVLGSNGSVVEVFKKQISKGGPITLTDPNMSRFVMTVDESVRLIMTRKNWKRREVFITKMPVIMIKDLAIAMIDDLSSKYGFKSKDIEIKTIGSKPGEKLYEELMNLEETRRALELNKYFSVMPALKNMHKDINYDYDEIISSNVDKPYISSEEKPLDVKEIKELLRKIKNY